jgi:trehalose/maltose hydrolase-like predicted phosphorylase
MPGFPASRGSGGAPSRAKQADVVMLFYLLPRKDLREIFHRLGYTWDDDTVRKTVEYYAARTSHGSTLSKVVHASVMDRFDRDTAWGLFREALRSDVADVQGGTTPEGVHLGAMSGTVDIVLRHHAGIDTTGEVLGIHPRLPARLKGLRLRLRHRGHWYRLTIDGDRFRLDVEEDAPGPVKIAILGERPTLAPGDHYECSLGAAGVLGT